MRRWGEVNWCAGGWWCGWPFSLIFGRIGRYDRGMPKARTVFVCQSCGGQHPKCTLAGFFRQYELFYVVADERDVIRLRTNVRKNPPEEVYLYRARVPRENVRRLFLDYIRE